MKKILLTAVSGLALTFGFAQTATNFTCNDCAGTNHDLFTELNAGKVIVISFIMPCGSCIAPSKAADNAVASFQSSNPGQVLFYASDDQGTNTCSSFNSWLSTNAITPDATITNPALKVTPYGTGTMNRVVVLGGSSHTVYYNAGSGVTQTNVQNAITTALNALTAVAEIGNISSYNVFPNPAASSTSISYTLEASADVTIDIYNMIGETQKTISLTNQASGQHQLDVDCSKLNSGYYFVRINSGKLEKTILLSVAH